MYYSSEQAVRDENQLNNQDDSIPTVPHPASLLWEIVGQSSRDRHQLLEIVCPLPRLSNGPSRPFLGTSSDFFSCHTNGDNLVKSGGCTRTDIAILQGYRSNRKVILQCPGYCNANSVRVRVSVECATYRVSRRCCDMRYILCCCYQ